MSTLLSADYPKMILVLHHINMLSSNDTIHIANDSSSIKIAICGSDPIQQLSIQP
jgi:hypothetical protein